MFLAVLVRLDGLTPLLMRSEKHKMSQECHTVKCKKERVARSFSNDNMHFLGGLFDQKRLDFRTLLPGNPLMLHQYVEQVTQLEDAMDGDVLGS